MASQNGQRVVGKVAGVFEFRRPGRPFRRDQDPAIHDRVAPKLGNDPFIVLPLAA